MLLQTMVIILEILFLLAWLSGRVVDSADVFHKEIAVLKAGSLSLSVFVLFLSALTLLIYAFDQTVGWQCIANSIVMMQLIVVLVVVVPFFLLVFYKLYVKSGTDEAHLLH